jgi:hypothetical protein
MMRNPVIVRSSSFVLLFSMFTALFAGGLACGGDLDCPGSALSYLSQVFQQSDCCDTMVADNHEDHQNNASDIAVMVPGNAGANCHPPQTSDHLQSSGIHHHAHSDECCDSCSCCGFDASPDVRTHDFIQVVKADTKTELPAPTVTETMSFEEVISSVSLVETPLLFASVAIHKRNQVFLN